MARHAAQSTGKSGVLGFVLGAIFSNTLAISLFAAGFAVCTLPQTTQLFSRLFSDFGTSAFLPEDTVSLAMATRDFTVAPYAYGAAAAAEELSAQVVDAAQRSATEGSPKADRWKNVLAPTPTDAASGPSGGTATNNGGTGGSTPSDSAASSAASEFSGPSDSLGLEEQTSSFPNAAAATGHLAYAAQLPSEEAQRILPLDTVEGKEADSQDPSDASAPPSTGQAAATSGGAAVATTFQGAATQQMYALAAHGQAYGLGPDAIDHLIDCNKLINRAAPVLIVVAVVALATGIALRVLCGRRAFGRALVAAPSLLVAAMLALGIWAAVDFYAFFAAFHGLFFPQGNWTFPADSLIICMLPTGFWVAMAACWVLVTVLCCIACVAWGLRLARR